MSIYKNAGVDIDAGNTFVSEIKNKVASTFNKNVINPLGGFASIFKLDVNKYKKPLLLSSTDGVGTKLKLAILSSKHKSIGIDLVAMCVNDLLVYGAEPLFFLDYLGTGKLDVEVSKDIIDGIVEGCKMANCALVGGETAEMPSFYAKGEYDLAGFTVGVVDEDKLIDGKNVEVGDAIIALASSGVHSNGYSLVRHIFFELNKYSLDHVFPELSKPLVDVLLEPTIIYVKPILNLLNKFNVKAMCHITGGGILENLPRVLPDNITAAIEYKSIKTPPIFSLIQKLGNVDNEEMFRVFNMGVGFIIVINKNEVDAVINDLKTQNIDSYKIGEITTYKNSKISVSGIS